MSDYTINFNDFTTEIVKDGRHYICHTSGGYAKVVDGSLDLIVIYDISYTDRFNKMVPEDIDVYQMFLKELEKALQTEELRVVA